MQRILFSILAVTILLPAAGAQEQAVITDPALDAFPAPANAWADITGASMEVVDDRVIRVGLTLAHLPEVQPGAIYCVVFSDGASDAFGCLAATPSVRYVYGDWRDGRPSDLSDAQGAYTTGMEGRVTIDVPRVAIRPDATELTALRAFSFDDKRGASPIELMDMVLLDEAAGDATLRLPPASTPQDVAGATAPPESTAQPDAGAPPATPEASAPVPAVSAPMAFMVLVALAWASGRRRHRP